MAVLLFKQSCFPEFSSRRANQSVPHYNLVACRKKTLESVYIGLEIADNFIEVQAISLLLVVMHLCHLRIHPIFSNTIFLK
ncbi:MAG: hypothetical protein J6Y19_00840 [Kiritimatiellae bacterium]|nr:hypothetical protein [Kiritimatiellia bacterium]